MSDVRRSIETAEIWLQGMSPPTPGEPVSFCRGVHLFLADNPSAWTFEGTNTWVLTDSGHAVVFDPGPEESAHQQTVADWIVDHDLHVEHVLVSHGHGDHAGGAKSLAGLVGLPGITDLRQTSDGTLLPFGAASSEQLVVYRTPGHTSDGVTLLWPGKRIALVGDTALSQVNPYIHHPDGTVMDILQSMDMLAGLVDDSWWLLPGHGPIVDNPRTHLVRRMESRHRRISEVRAHHLAGLDEEQIVTAMYGDRDETTRMAAIATVRALLAYIRGGSTV